MTAVYVIVVIAAVAVLLFATSSIKILREYQRLVLFRLGRVTPAKGPGLVLVNPITDRVQVVDMREQYLEIPHQVAITEDNASISIDFIMFFRVVDPRTSVVAVNNFRGAALNISATTLRSVVGDMSLDHVLSKRDHINDTLQVKLDEVTERWGVKVTNVEVREIKPPPAVLDAMTRQMSAERTRRAVVTEAEGTKSAAVTVAEGEKFAAILAAEGDKQAKILSAEAQKQTAILQAEGLAAALSRISAAARGVDPNTVTFQYLDTLRSMAASGSNTVLIPSELSGLAAGLAANVREAGANAAVQAANGTAA